MWKLFSIKIDFSEFLLVKTQIFGQIWELSFEIWWISGLQSEQTSNNFNFEQVDFKFCVLNPWVSGSMYFSNGSVYFSNFQKFIQNKRSVYRVRVSVCPCIFLIPVHFLTYSTKIAWLVWQQLHSHFTINSWRNENL